MNLIYAIVLLLDVGKWNPHHYPEWFHPKQVLRSSKAQPPYGYPTPVGTS